MLDGGSLSGSPDSRANQIKVTIFTELSSTHDIFTFKSNRRQRFPWSPGVSRAPSSPFPLEAAALGSLLRTSGRRGAGGEANVFTACRHMKVRHVKHF